MTNYYIAPSQQLTRRHTEKTSDDINKAGIRFGKDAKVIDKMEINTRNDCFIILKDHKENFENNPKTRLINPAKKRGRAYKQSDPRNN